MPGPLPQPSPLSTGEREQERRRAARPNLVVAVRVAGEVLLLVWALSYLRYRVGSHEGRVLLAVLPRGTPRDLSYDQPLEEQWKWWEIARQLVR